ncbi:MAG: extensin family protein [Paracoccaceae bacterium]
MRRAFAALVICAALPVAAAPMKKSLLPQPRPVIALPQVPAGTAIAQPPPKVLAPRPRPRPEGLVVASASPAPQVAVEKAPDTAPDTAMTPVPRPLPRPDGLVPAASDQPSPEPRGGLFGLGKRKQKTPPATTGYVCGDPDIKGQSLPRIGAKVKGCGIENPVRVTSVDGIRLSQAATIDCDTATALKSWINRGLRPAFKGREVVELKVAASYICRPRNNVKGAKISEHGRGQAIDIAGIVTSDGRTQMVAGGFDQTLRTAYKAGCGIFGTTLGPGSDGYHEDHMHFDTASYRNGAYCR